MSSEDQRAVKARARLLTLVRVLREQASEQVGLVAAGAAFWLVISAFPMATAAVSLFGLIVSPERVAGDLGSLAQAAPDSLGVLITQQLHRVAASDHAGLSVGLVISVVLSLWSASAGVYNLDRAIRDAYSLPRQAYIDARGRAMVGALGIVLAVGTLALIASLVADNLPGPAVVILGVPTLLAALTAGIAGFYRLSVGDRATLRTLVPGALLASAGVVLLIVAFGVYVAVSAKYAAVYGAFAGGVVGMIATYLTVYAVLIGAVLNLVREGATPSATRGRPGAAGRR